MDNRTPAQRRATMAAVKSRHTGPELKLRRLLFSQGFRYRLHYRHLPGSPDIVFPGRKKVVFVHGCFWHGHGCKGGRLPKSRVEYWGAKQRGNRQRDKANVLELTRLGWGVAVVWQCEIAKEPETTMNRLAKFLNAG